MTNSITVAAVAPVLTWGQALSQYSDHFKDVHGFRPTWFPQTGAELEAAQESLDRCYAIETDWAKEREEARLASIRKRNAERKELQNTWFSRLLAE